MDFFYSPAQLRQATVNEPLSAVILADLSAAFFIRRFSGGVADWQTCPLAD
jgi:hypothetical protein